MLMVLIMLCDSVYTYVGKCTRAKPNPAMKSKKVSLTFEKIRTIEKGSFGCEPKRHTKSTGIQCTSNVKKVQKMYNFCDRWINRELVMTYKPTHNLKRWDGNRIEIKYTGQKKNEMSSTVRGKFSWKVVIDFREHWCWLRPEQGGANVRKLNGTIINASQQAVWLNFQISELNNPPTTNSSHIHRFHHCG